MSTTFPRTRNSRRGYSIDQVEDFLEDARQAYAAQPGAPVAVDAATIRHMAFAMQKGGYSAVHVDAALERLEDAFATRERERAIQERGDEAWYSEARTIAQEVLARLGRPAGHRFDRVSVLSKGYNHKDVDAVATRLTRYFKDGSPLSIDDVRTAAFRPQAGGYREAQVDLLLDAVVNVMLAVR
ncbi:MAG: transporter permease [Microbacteriaceae bacterium]|nr:transporter permease [Microbacteriaceae bacterium]